LVELTTAEKDWFILAGSSSINWHEPYLYDLHGKPSQLALVSTKRAAAKTEEVEVVHLFHPNSLCIEPNSPGNWCCLWGRDMLDLRSQKILTTLKETS
jgi:hypothetical protein